jgi:copper transport protein
MTRLRSFVVIVATAIFVLTLAAPAHAHSGFVSSTPDAGAQLGTAPGVVVVRFSEPLNVRLSRAQVTTPDGTRMGGKPTGQEQISITLETGEQGVYRVTWTTVSLVDGHTLSGSFAFGVGVPVAASDEATTSSSPRMTDLLIAVGRVVEDTALLAAVGLLLMGRVARRQPALAWVRSRPTVALVLALIGGTAVVLGESLAAAGSLSAGAVASYLTTGLPGFARLVRPVLELIALGLASTDSRWTAVPLGGAVLALAAAGHAAAVDPMWWGVAVEALHVGAGALWVGGILALAFQHPPGGWLGEEGRVLLDRFTPVAIVAFSLTALAGVLRGVQEVGSLRELIGSTYGLTLLAKTAFVVLVLQLSFFAWRRLLVAPRAEAGITIGVVLLAALLAAYPLPPARVADAEAADIAEANAPSALPIGGDVTLGGSAGEYLVGLTVRPSTNDVYVFLQGLGSDEDTAAAEVSMTTDGRPLVVTECAPTCRRSTGTVTNGDRVLVSVAGPQGGTAAFIIPDLSSPGADDVLTRMMDQMHALHTYRLQEDLSSGQGTVRSTYAFEAPASFEARTIGPDGTLSMVKWINDTRYLRTSPSGAWRVERGGGAPTVPLYVWDTFQPFIDARSIGSQTVAGVRTDEVIFFGGEPGLPVWFRMWIDHTGLVRRAEMRAPGHFMNHRYFAFDAPFSIKPPTGIGS